MTNKVYVLGGAQTDFERNWSKEGKGVIALLKEAIDDGLKSIDITYEDIIELNKQGKVACFVGNFIAELYVDQGHLGALLTEVNPAFYGVPSARYEAACASGSVAIDAAISKIKAEDYELALVIGWELMKTVDAKICGDYLGRAAFYEDEAEGIDFPFPKLFGQLADETIKKYKLDEERYLNTLAQISVKNYANAKRNPNAQTRKWFMNNDQAKTRGTSTNSIVGGKLGISDCSQVTDGAVFVALASENFTKEKYKHSDFPIVKGWGHRVAPMRFSKKIEESSDNEYILPWTRQAVLDAYQRAGLKAEDMDFFETHDCFTSSEYAAISAFGITGPGHELEAVENGHIDFQGKQPINPSGGLIGCGHPVGASGVRMFLDLFKQVAGKAEGYQLAKADNGMMLNIGGSATTNYVFIVGKE
ncbi:MAG TPA: thiolase domain-containing protein [Epulopiscium sp.]|nr:thiolase domain-containing protein [Candidatus Epulonipiscium sp.]